MKKLTEEQNIKTIKYEGIVEVIPIKSLKKYKGITKRIPEDIATRIAQNRITEKVNIKNIVE